MLDVIVESRDHCAKKTKPKAVRIALANTAISSCFKPQTPAIKITTAIEVKRCTAFVTIFLLALCTEHFSKHGK